MAMVFTLTSFIEDWIAKNFKNSSKSVRLPNASEGDDFGSSSKKPTVIEEKIIDEGTPVTKESFLVWRDRFLKENVGNLKGPAAQLGPVLKESKITGKQLFEQNKALAASDAAFADDGVALESKNTSDFCSCVLFVLLVDETVFEGINFDDLNGDEEEVAYDNRGQISDEDN
jgi:hypothetical protein